MSSASRPSTGIRLALLGPTVVGRLQPQGLEVGTCLALGVVDQGGERLGGGRHVADPQANGDQGVVRSIRVEERVSSGSVGVSEPAQSPQPASSPNAVPSGRRGDAVEDVRRCRAAVEQRYEGGEHRRMPPAPAPRRRRRPVHGGDPRAGSMSSRSDGRVVLRGLVPNGWHRGRRTERRPVSTSRELVTRSAGRRPGPPRRQVAVARPSARRSTSRRRARR